MLPIHAPSVKNCKKRNSVVIAKSSRERAAQSCGCEPQVLAGHYIRLASGGRVIRRGLATSRANWFDTCDQSNTAKQSGKGGRMGIRRTGPGKRTSKPMVGDKGFEPLTSPV